MKKESLKFNLTVFSAALCLLMFSLIIITATILNDNATPVAYADENTQNVDCDEYTDSGLMNRV